MQKLGQKLAEENKGIINPSWSTLMTKKQVEAILKSHNYIHGLPRKGIKVFINTGEGCTTITKTDKKSTYGKLLYQVDFYPR